MKTCIAFSVVLLLNAGQAFTEDNSVLLKERIEALKAAKNYSDIPSLAEIANSKTLVAQVFGYIARTRLLKVGDDPSYVEMVLEKPHTTCKEGAVWFYGDAIWGWYVVLTFENNRLKEFGYSANCW